MVYLDCPCRQYIYVQSESFRSSYWYYHYNAVWEERLDQIVHKYILMHFLIKMNCLSGTITPFFSYLTMLLILKDVERYLYSFYEEKKWRLFPLLSYFPKKIPNDLLEMWNQQTNLGPHPQTPDTEKKWAGKITPRCQIQFADYTIYPNQPICGRANFQANIIHRVS